MKSSPNSKLGKVGVSSNIAQNHSSSLYEVIPFHYLPHFTLQVDQKWNYEIRQSHYVPLFGFIYSYFAPINHFGPNLALFIYIFQYLALFTYIYPHLALFGYIYH